MTEIRVALLSVHTSALAPLGAHDSGGMNIYVRRLSDRPQAKLTAASSPPSVSQ